MRTHLYDFDLDKKEIIIVKSDDKIINRVGWIFPCISCTTPTSRIKIINNCNGVVKSFMCKDCNKVKYNHYLDYYYYFKKYIM